LHHADGVGVEALLDLADLEGADVGSRELTEPKTPEEGHQVVAVSSLVAIEGALANLIAGRVGEPTLEILTDRQPPRVREQDPLGLVGEGLEHLVVGLLGGRAVEAHTPAARERVQRGTGLVAAVLALARVCARSVRVLPLRPGHGAMIPRDLLPGPARQTAFLSSDVTCSVVFYASQGCDEVLRVPEARSIQAPACELRRIPLPRTSVNKGKNT
jgi:hypothetical protein